MKMVMMIMIIMMTMMTIDDDSKQGANIQQHCL